MPVHDNPIPRSTNLQSSILDFQSPTANLSAIRAVLLDMDGVLYVGDSPLPGVQDFLDYLDATDRRWLCVTNNASKTPPMFTEKLAAMGVHAPPDHIFSSAQATAMWLAEQIETGQAARGKVIMLGMEGLRCALLDAGLELTDDPFDAAYAVVGAHFHVTYDDFADLTLAIRNGARFIGTNPDTSFPSERGLLPGTGSLLALLAAASEVEPLIIGKPNAAMFEEAMRLLHTEPAETLMVGDRYETDIAGAIKLGMPTAGVLTGITSEEGFRQADPPPALIAADLPALLAAFRNADKMRG
jgi:4-nitrophenyl phosphatase